MTHVKRCALKELKEMKNIVIKKSDKEGNVVLMNENHYEKEARRLLNDRSTYRRLDYNPFPEVVRELNQNNRNRTPPGYRPTPGQRGCF